MTVLTAFINVIWYDYFHRTQPHLGSWLKPQKRWFWENLSIPNNSYSFDDCCYLKVQKERLQSRISIHSVLCPSAIGKMHMLEILTLKLMALLLHVFLITNEIVADYFLPKMLLVDNSFIPSLFLFGTGTWHELVGRRVRISDLCWWPVLHCW